MKINKCDFSFEYDMIHCPSTNEYIYMPGWESFDFKATAFIAYWLDDSIDEPIFNNKELQDAWEIVYQKWAEEEGHKPHLYEVLEKFLAAYENPEWIVHECMTSGIACGPVSNTAYFVVKADTVVDLDPDYELEYAEDGDEEEEPENQIEVIETGYPVNCPFCGELIRDDDEDSPCFYEGGRCDHLLFEATDYGFEYRSEKFNQHTGIEARGEGYSDKFYPTDDEYGFDGYTSKVSIPGSIKFAIYEGLGGSLGAYFGFAP